MDHIMVCRLFNATALAEVMLTRAIVIETVGDVFKGNLNLDITIFIKENILHWQLHFVQVLVTTADTTGQVL